MTVSSASCVFSWPVGKGVIDCRQYLSQPAVAFAYLICEIFHRVLECDIVVIDQQLVLELGLGL